jgi:acetyl esterase/lipase/lysophospholipase L1-like esterase
MTTLKHKITVLFLACLVALKVNAQEIVPLYTGTIPGNLKTKNEEKISKPATGRPSVSNVTHPTITVFLPKQQNKSRSSVIICPGGGYVRLTIEDGGYETAKAFADAGVTAFVLKYRTWQDSTFSDYRNIPLQDLAQALKLVHQGATKWNLDTAQVGLLGFSAGGHLAAMGATSSSIPRTAFTILVYPVVSFMDSLVSPTLRSRASLLGKAISEKDKLAYSPDLQVRSTTPPAFIVHAQDDSTSFVGNSIAYYKALTAKKIKAQLLVYQKGGHGFAMNNVAMKESWFPSLLKWMELNGWHQQNVAEAKPVAPAFYSDILSFKKLDSANLPSKGQILFVGSSSFTKWKDVDQYFPGYKILNRGFGGSTIVDVIRYAYDVIIPYQPKQVLIYCGENDLASADSVTADVVVNRFKTLFGMIRQNLPQTTISFVSIKPSPVRASIQTKVKEANRKIEAFIKTQKHAQFINIYNAMLTNGAMREELFVADRLHMNASGYAIWQKIIGPFLLR